MRDKHRYPYKGGSPISYGFYLMGQVCNPAYMRRPPEADMWQARGHMPKELYTPGKLPQHYWAYDKHACYLAACAGLYLPIWGRYGGYSTARVLEPWYQYLRDWRNETMPGSDERALIREIYSRTIGALAHMPDPAPVGFIWRPDWHNAIVLEARKRMQLQIDKVAELNGGIRPVALRLDCAYYTQPVEGFPMGGGIGMYELEVKV